MLEFGRGPGVAAAEFAARVNRERDRRIGLGFYWGPHLFDFDRQTKERITGAGALAIGAMLAGAQPGDALWAGGADPFVWVLKDNTQLPLDAPDMLAVAAAAAAHERAHVFAGISIKGGPRPLDFTDDSLWPPVPGQGGL